MRLLCRSWNAGTLQKNDWTQFRNIAQVQARTLHPILARKQPLGLRCPGRFCLTLRPLLSVFEPGEKNDDDVE